MPFKKGQMRTSWDELGFVSVVFCNASIKKDYVIQNYMCIYQNHFLTVQFITKYSILENTVSSL